MQDIMYSVTGILALLIHIIINYDIFVPQAHQVAVSVHKGYRNFIIVVALFYLSDILWGVAAKTGSASFLYIVTYFYFAMIATAVLFWDFFVIEYLNMQGKLKNIFLLLGFVLFIFVLVFLVINIINSNFFWIDENGMYSYGSGRAHILLSQAFLFLLTSVRTGYRAATSTGLRRQKYAVVCSFGVILLIAGLVQVNLPVLPIYSMGLVIGCCAIHSFVVEADKEQMRLLLAEQKEAAEKASEAKTSFLFSMSHDIRTPMNAIMGYTDLAKRVPDNPEKTNEYLDKIVFAEENLLNLVNNILEMARIESGSIVVNPKPTDISEDMGKTMLIFEGLAKEKHITLQGHSDISNPYVMEDESLDAQIAINIVSNAIKYTNEGGKVDVYLTQLPSDSSDECILEFKVVDNGIGMSEEFLEHAFDNFSREETSTDSKIQGAGLGLGIVKKLIDQMGGTIEIQSKKGLGTTVTVHTKHRYCSREDVYTTVSTKEMIIPTLVGHRILVAEDNELNLEIIIGVLEELKLNVESVTNGKEACDKLLEMGAGYYDLVLMDIQMPIMNGYEATKIIRKFENQELGNIPIIAMTANAFEDDKRNALRIGMNDHLAKPINIDKLISVLGRYIN